MLHSNIVLVLAALHLHVVQSSCTACLVARQLSAAFNTCIWSDCFLLLHSNFCFGVECSHCVEQGSIPHLQFTTVDHCLAWLAGDALADGSQAGLNSSVDNVYQQSLAMDATQATTDWQVSALP